MTDETKRGGPPVRDTAHRDPRETTPPTDKAEEAKRREVEEAQHNKEKAEKEQRGDTLGSVADINSAMTSRD